MRDKGLRPNRNDAIDLGHAVVAVSHCDNVLLDEKWAAMVNELRSSELGVSNDIENLWPESFYTEPFNARVKDRLEDRMAANVRHKLEKHGHDAVTVLLKEYQTEIATDWIAAYRKYVSAPPPKRFFEISEGTFSPSLHGIGSII